MNASGKQQRGFTLVEIAIVLLIVTVLLGYSVAMFPMQQELKQYRHVNSEMESIIEHLIAFAQVSGRLPCPDTSTDNVLPANSIDGEEDRDGTNACEAYFGFLPAETLGINGKYDDAGVLVDPWSQRYGYAVSEVDVGGDKVLVTPNGVRAAGIAGVTPDLFVCSDSNILGNHADCTAAGSNQVVGNVAAVVISLGKDYELPASSNIQAENADDFHDGTNDKVYIFTGRRDDYDDVVKWVSTNLLFSRMIAAEQLP
ncbi:MAG: type II secretion system GspH family protein [Gammaproteobacteria bacterium]|nr:type II secretion system GspH family protein [Gammaproteobacteria bacterium]